MGQSSRTAPDLQVRPPKLRGGTWTSRAGVDARPTRNCSCCQDSPGHHTSALWIAAACCRFCRGGACPARLAQQAPALAWPTPQRRKDKVGQGRSKQRPYFISRTTSTLAAGTASFITRPEPRSSLDYHPTTSTSANSTGPNTRREWFLCLRLFKLSLLYFLAYKYHKPGNDDTL